MSTQNSGKNSGLRPWKRGQSGNPGGRPKANIALRTKCRELDDEMLERLKVIAHVADTDAASVAAIKLLLAYGHGAPESKPIPDDEEELDMGKPVSPDKAMAVLLRLPVSHEEPADEK